MRNIDDLMALVNIKELKELKNDVKEKDKRIELYNEVLEKVELFLTFWYKESKEFGKIKDDFNESDEVNAKLLLKNDRIKIKIEE